RIGYTIYTPTMTLSNDEQFMYLGETDPAECEAAGFFGDACLARAVSVLDLSTGEVTATVPLPQGCHWVAITPLRDNEAVLACAISGDVLVIGPDGSVSNHVTFEA